MDPTNHAAAPGERAALPRCIAVSVGGVCYGLPLSEVQEVIGMRPLTRVFHAPSELAGVTSLRGDVLPVIDLGLMLGTSQEARDADARIVVVRESAGQKRRAGFMVDLLLGLRELPHGELMAAPQTVSSALEHVILGVIPDPPPCAVLSVAAIFDSPKLAALSGSERAVVE